MRFIIIISTLMAASVSFAEIPNLLGKIKGIEASSKACSENATSNLDDSTCIADKYSQADKLLNEFYADAVSTLKAGAIKEAKLSDREKTSEETLNRLLASERLWVKFRDADCDLSGTQMLHGAGEGMVISQCLADKTLERVKQLSEIFQGIGSR